MTSIPAPPPLQPQVLDQLVELARRSRETWAAQGLEQRIGWLTTLVQRTDAAAEDWVAAALAGKGVARGSAGEGEEWISGPWALLASLTALRRTLTLLARAQPVVGTDAIHVRPSGQVMLDVFPRTPWDRLLLSGVSAQVWMRPEVTRDTVATHVARMYREPPPPTVSVVLGAGNIASIPPLDILNELFAENRVVVCKLNPVNAYLQAAFEQIFAPFIERGWVAFVTGGADVGEYLVRHHGVDKVHITGSAATHDAIVFGRGEEGRARKARNEPLLAKPITSELGGVGPVIVVPGAWSDADLDFQAQHVATMKLHNVGFNCIAAQVLVVHRDWPLKERFLARVKQLVESAAARPAYYPGCVDRQAALAQKYPRAERLGGDGPRTRVPGVDPGTEPYALTTELFGPMYAEVELDGRDAADFLSRAVELANHDIAGTLGCQILVHPRTAVELGSALDTAVAALRYGTIGLNAWSGAGFLIPTACWGAYPGHTLDDIQSGRGVVHNALLLDGSEKNVVRQPFAPFPRTLKEGELHTLPLPPWFITHRKSGTVGRLLARFEANPSPARLPELFFHALTG